MMNRSAQIVGRTLANIFALFFLILIFLLFLVLFKFSVKEIGSVGSQQGDLAAEHILAYVMSQPIVVEGRQVMPQDGLNDPGLRMKMHPLITSKMGEILQSLKYREYAVRVFLKEGKSISDQSMIDPVSKRDDRFFRLRQAYSCWPYHDEDKISLLYVQLADQAQDLGAENLRSKIAKGEFPC